MHQHLQRNTTAWYETKHDLILTCNTNDQANQFDMALISGEIGAGNCEHQSRHTLPLLNYTDQSPKRSGVFLIS